MMQILGQLMPTSNAVRNKVKSRKEAVRKESAESTEETPAEKTLENCFMHIVPVSRNIHVQYFI